MASYPGINGSDGEDLISIARDVRQLLLRMNERLEAISRQISAISTAQLSSAQPADQYLGENTPETLRARLAEARAASDPFTVLDLRRALAEKLDEADREELDRDLAQWFTHHFHQSLRSGHAVVVAGAIERAVEELGSVPEMRMLADSLPLILRSVGLYQESRDEPNPPLD